jgi:nicotinamide phosphoribosyltransferase
MNVNLILDTDSYKYSHFLQYPSGTESIYSYLESRGGRYKETLFFGLQPILKDLERGISLEDVKEAEAIVTAHGLPFNRTGWEYIATQLKGRLPIQVRAVPEGSIVPTNHILMSVESTDPQVFWIGSFLETIFMRVWYPITVATQSWHCKKLIYRFLEKTSDDPKAEIEYKLHDFGARGVSSRESAALGGAAHLVNFQGSDTVVGIVLANRCYHHAMAGFSIPAAEHSTIISWGKEKEADAYRHIFRQFGKPGKIVAVVSDSYDLWNALEHLWGEELKNEVTESGATLVIRPDSGKPCEIVLKTLEILDLKFGSYLNTKGYKVLNYVRLIQGDGIDEKGIQTILETITSHGYSATNVAFGMGGALLQHVNRDTLRFAYKCSEVTVQGKPLAVCKDPITDPKKRSKAGRLDLIKRDGKYETYFGSSPKSELVTVFENGKIVKDWTLDQVRARSWN